LQWIPGSRLINVINMQAYGNCYFIFLELAAITYSLYWNHGSHLSNHSWNEPFVTANEDDLGRHRIIKSNENFLEVNKYTHKKQLLQLVFIIYFV